MTILCYHSVDPDWESPLAVHPKDFAAQSAWLARHRQVVPLNEALKRLDGAGRLPRGVAALTFDDGFSGLYDHAMRMIVDHRLPVTVFLVAQTLTAEGQTVDWVKTAPSWPLKTLTRDQVLEMQTAGVDFQSHSWAHRDLPSLDYDSCVEDLRASRELLEDLLGKPVPVLAYPRGLHDEQVRRAATSAGYAWGLGLPERSEQAGPYAVPRVGIHRDNGMAAFRIKCAHRYLSLRTRLNPHVLRKVKKQN